MNCDKCELLSELFERTPKCPRDYWMMTELFTMLHDGKDYCDIIGSHDRLNEAPQMVDSCTAYLRGRRGRFKPENPDENEICLLALSAGASFHLRDGQKG